MSQLSSENIDSDQNMSDSPPRNKSEYLAKARAAKAVRRTENEDDEYSSEEEEKSRPKQKKKKDRYGGFILDECEVGEADEEDEWEEGASECGLASESNEVGLTAQNIETYHHGNTLWGTQKEEEIGEYLRKKYGDKKSVPERSFSDAGETSDAVAQQALLPSIRDPNLWMVKCLANKEAETALSLMRKCITNASTGKPSKIKSVIASPRVKGYIYIEATKQSDVREAIANVSNLRMGRYKQLMVPLNEMPAVLHVPKRKPPVQPKQWVRVKRGLYKDDIAQVDVVDLAQNEVQLKLVPRIDYNKMRGALKNTKKETDENKRKKKIRPTPRLFDSAAIRAIGGDVHPDGELLLFERQRYNRKGLLLKNFQISAILTDGVKPTLEELERFAVPLEDIDLDIQIKEESEKKNSFSVDDTVEVCAGELENLQGKVLAIDGDKVTILPKGQGFKMPMTFKACELQKFFKIGDHAKVVAGCFKGESGIILKVTPPLIVLLSDTSNQEMTVSSRVVHQYLSADTADDTAVDDMGQFKWGDMVQLDPERIGVIVKLEPQFFEVLDMKGELLKCTAASMQKKWHLFDLFALDAEHNQIRRRDTVKVLEGPNSGRSAEIKHLYRSYVFLYCCMYMQNGGMFVCKPRQLLLLGKSNSESRFRPNFDGHGSVTPSIRSPMASPGQHGVHWKGDNKAQIDRAILGKTVKVIGGPYKGNVGIIRNTTGDLVRIEGHTTFRHISVERRLIAIIGDQGHEGNLPISAHMPMRTPSYETHTPSGSKTPVFGCKTPGWESGERLPSSLSMTPSHDDSVTPRNNSWDPNVTSTPIRSATLPISNNPAAKPSPSGYHTSPVAYTDSSNNKPPPQPQGNETPDWDADEKNNYDGTTALQNDGVTSSDGDTSGASSSNQSYTIFKASPKPFGCRKPLPVSTITSFKTAGNPKSIFDPEYESQDRTDLKTSSKGEESEDWDAEENNSDKNLKKSEFVRKSEDPTTIPTPPPYAVGFTNSAEASTYASQFSYDPKIPKIGVDPLTTWVTADIEVQIGAHNDADLVGQTGVICSVSHGQCSVFLYQEERCIAIGSGNLVAVPPKPGDKFKLIRGDEKQPVGKVIGAVDKYTSLCLCNDEVKMIPTSYLCKMRS